MPLKAPAIVTNLDGILGKDTIVPVWIPHGKLLLLALDLQAGVHWRPLIVIICNIIDCNNYNIIFITKISQKTERDSTRGLETIVKNKTSSMHAVKFHSNAQNRRLCY